eukprot:CAMPEP_0114584286 /NCGR_PEP_ID=MMETSP0125-20121206/8007_1 /TAXON_ID=485358 ORGANISM="Aristerostoma sp., Strain ATCC 50986" /NCGR_SAMPLE_ID=MMETSP0125 /ASSEMBLY_ACC=CAM_ASM_000245 /LENGTH=33 /DNA_ID= /DNA_START= /DNA_END= /DNA_ORIENTATION=
MGIKVDGIKFTQMEGDFNPDGIMGKSDAPNRFT